MVPTTAVCFLLLAAALPLSALDRPLASDVSLVLSLSVTGFAIVNALVRFLVADQGIDALLTDRLQAQDRMGWVTIFGFTLAGGVVFLQGPSGGSPWRDRMAGYASIFGLSLFGALLAGHSFDPTDTRHVAAFGGVSAYTAILFVLIFAAALLAPRLREASVDEPID